MQKSQKSEKERLFHISAAIALLQAIEIFGQFPHNIRHSEQVKAGAKALHYPWNADGLGNARRLCFMKALKCLGSITRVP